jgi:putative membrane protein
MFLELLFFVLAGVAVGTFTGLLPGIHPNTVLTLLLSAAPLLLFLPAEYALAFIVSLAVSNTFTDFIPSIFLGAPDPEVCLSVLPGHSLLLAGRGYEALCLAVSGCLGATLLTIASLPLLLAGLPYLYSMTRPFLALLLGAVVALMVIREGRSAPAALLVLLLSGAFGLVSLNALPESQSLFPALTGMFGISGLLVSLHAGAPLPKQEFRASLRPRMVLRGSFTGWLAGLLSGLLPGIGSSQAGALASEVSGSRRREFLVALGGISTANIIFTFLVFYLLGKVRSGAAQAVSQALSTLGPADLTLILASGLLSCFLSAAATLLIGKRAVRIAELDYKRVTLVILASLAATVALLSGPVGLLVCLAGTLLGLAAILSGVRRTHMMGFLIIPTILFFSGWQAGALLALGL